MKSICASIHKLHRLNMTVIRLSHPILDQKLELGENCICCEPTWKNDVVVGWKIFAFRDYHQMRNEVRVISSSES